ncbi:hypothetical protein CEV33_3777 [Brucella grignonensis]|uniref:Uncharacterized protein n=1 Tax=Brucella grignonensis TaxID=94627 RepID=A0A256EY79_9HYPH|nr:hypothetical protein CEV33_3777 [Brucella grignonensis]
MFPNVFPQGFYAASKGSFAVQITNNEGDCYLIASINMVKTKTS